MYNLKRCGGSFKGLIGECLFKLTDKDLIITRFFNKSKWFDIFGQNLTLEQKEFLNQFWFSIDAIKITFKPEKKVYLFEVKTRNKHKNPKSFWRPKFTQSTVDVYNQAEKLGLEVKIATIWLLNDWEFKVEIEDFKNADFCIDKPKQYDLKMPEGSFKK